MQAKSSQLLRKAIAGILLVPGIHVPAAMAQQDQTIEQIVVTGSYLRSSNSFDTSSPMAVLDSTDIAEQGVMQMADVIKNQTFNIGTDYVANPVGPFGGANQDGFDSFANLRGLGSGATLTLINGRRTLNSNVNMLYPQIAIGRIETLKDGGSALYGSDAVGGVVNVIPRMGFEGIETSIRHQPSTEGDDYDESSFNILMGGGGDQTRFVAALEYRDRGLLKMIDRPEYARAGFMRSTTGNPGTWSVPTRNPDGTLTGAQMTTVDPACGIDNGPGGTDRSKRFSFVSGEPNADRTSCGFDYTEYWDFMPAMESVTTWGLVEHKFSDNLTFVSEFNIARATVDGRGSKAQAGGRFAELGAIPGEHPGNPFRAMADRGNGLEPIFAQDLDGDGMPDRNPNGQVMLAADPYNPNQGVAFNEDVTPTAMRLLSKLSPVTPLHNADESTQGYFNSNDNQYRWSGGFEYEIPDSTWYAEAYWSHQRINNIQQNNTFASFRAVRDGIDGRLGPNNDQYLNPFATSVWQCVNRVCDPNSRTQPGDPAYNSPEVMESVWHADPTISRHTYHQVDALATGEVFELPAGPVSMAFGGQWRETNIDSDQGSLGNTCDRWLEACSQDFQASRRTKAVFTEIGVPLLNGGPLGELDLNAAVRYEDSGLELQTTDPKVGLRWSPLPFLALRSSYSTSFVAPGLSQTIGPIDEYPQQMRDLTCEASGDCVDLGATRNIRFGPNASLQSESADIWSAGFTVNLFDDDLSFYFDYLDFDFTDRISSESGQDVLARDLPRFEAFLAGGGTRDQWIDPANKATGNFESQAIERTAGGEIVNVFTSFINSDSMTWKGFDIGMSYNWDGDEMPFVNREIGSFVFRLDGTYTEEYNITTGKTGEVKHGAGVRNGSSTSLPPVPRIRANGNLGWLMGQHSATIIARYTHHVRDDGIFSFANPDYLNSRVTYDAQYTLSLDSILGFDSQAGVTLGCINCFETMPDPMFDFGGLDTMLYDPRGRMWYAKLSLNF